MMMATNQDPIGDRVSARPITDVLRRQVREELPEVARISDQVLHARTVEAWAYALGGSSRSGSAGPPYAIPPSAPAFAWVCRRRLRISLCAFRQGRASRAQPRLHDRASGQLHLLEHTFGGGQLKPETVAIDKRRYVTDRPL